MIAGTFQNTGHGWWNESDVAQTVRTPDGGGSMEANVVAHSLRADGFDTSEDGTGRGVPLVLAHGQGNAEIGKGIGTTLNCNHEAPIVFDPNQVTLPGNYSNPKAGDPCHPLLSAAPPLMAFTQNTRDEVRDLKDVTGAISSEPGTHQTTYVAGFYPTARREFPEFEDQSPTVKVGSGIGIPSPPGVRIGMSVRRLLPAECEKLQGFTEVRKSVTIVLCGDHQKNHVLAVIENLRLQSSVGNAEKQPSEGNALSAGRDLNALHPKISKPAEANVEINIGAGTIKLTTPEKESLESVRNAEGKSNTRQAGAIVNSALLLAHLLTELDRIVPVGKEELPNFTSDSLAQKNGKRYVLLSGQEIEGYAENADQNTTNAIRSMKSITSEVGLNFQNFEQTLKTLCCSVGHAISSFIPGSIKRESLFFLNLTIVNDYTAIVYKNKPAADGPRYKAIGNSMCVDVVEDILERIELVGFPIVT